MNRLVIIGNGFDLAHGLPTSYKHFIDDFWANIKDNYLKEEYQKLIFVKEKDCFFENITMVDFESLKKYCEECNTKKSIYTFYLSNFELKRGSDIVFKFESSFFKLINIKNTENWVDIENEYYSEIKKIINSPDTVKEKKDAVFKLNEEFDQVKNLLEKYLIRVEEELSESYESEIYLTNAYFDKGSRSLENSDFPKKDYDEIAKFKMQSFVNQIPFNLYFLNFNYTNTIDKYIENFSMGNKIEHKQIQIHGRLKDKMNQINFGFGDEMDDDYKKIENINDNEYLRNFKSFQYLQNSNYKNLLDYVDSEKYQIYIMGHSCGLSDRTLLNTIFEHENCRSIKIFYHKKENETDNYTEIVQNISRHFKDKALMREKIVNKSLSIPLPINLEIQKL